MEIFTIHIEISKRKGFGMKAGDLVRIENIFNYDPSQEVKPGYLMQITTVIEDGGYWVIILEGPHLGAEHWISGEELVIA